MPPKQKTDRPKIIGVAMNGARIDFTDAPLLTWFKSGYLWATLFFIIVIMSIFDPASEVSSRFSANVTIAFWLGVVVFYLALLLIFLPLISLIYRALGWEKLILPIFSFFVVIALMNFGEIWIHLIEEEALIWKRPNYWHFPFYYVMEQAFLTIYVSVVHPWVRGQPVPDEDPPTAPPPAFVRIDKKRFRVEDVQHIRVTEHYLHVTSRHGQDVLRARLGDVVSELGDAVGVQIHRSTWVAFAAIQSVQEQDGKLRIQMSDGTSYQVARSRKQAVLDRLRSAGISIE